MNVIIKAAQFAEERHRGQIRKGTGRPYTDHLYRVAGQFAAHHDATESGVAIALLHDTLEDTNATATDLVERFGADVATGVALLTKIKDNRPRAERNADYFQRLARAPYEIRLIKLIDRLDNLSEVQNMSPDFVEQYCRESLHLLTTMRNTNQIVTDNILERQILDRITYLSKNWDNQRIQVLEKHKSNLIEILEACIATMETLPTLNGICGLSILEKAKDVVSEVKGK
jgi:(p)ppGpp synthase/HD superfamily hydrolase